ncbi:MAG: hypothetical protein HY912_21125 [Desulfomonile tiedjei]|uniref:Uncharacterized protein n=1 Tax=Desulfomonile tiedjei TaxID=2358 RepID=A0A9D6V5Q7_9BACT|nr:hypothetical protein [Desulfomonile tiedjei]
MGNKEGHLKAMTERCSAQGKSSRSHASRATADKSEGVVREEIGFHLLDGIPRSDRHRGQSPGASSRSRPSKPTSPHEPTCAPEVQEPSPARKPASGSNGGAILVLSLIFLAVAVALTLLSLFLCTDQYCVETRLLFTTDMTGNGAALSPEAEIRLLGAPAITSILEKDLFKKIHSSGDLKASECVEPAILTTAPCTTALGTASPDQRMAFRHWFWENLAVQSEIQGQTGWVTLALNGTNPDFMKKVLESYLVRYAEYRRVLSQEASESTAKASEPCEPAFHSKEIEALSGELQKMDLYERNCSLALNLLADSASGVFSGFVPDGGVTGIPLLARFQEKIIQLELTKKELLARFTPQSREIRELQLQIQGVRTSMRECLEAHLKFLKKGKEQLVAHKAELERKRGPVRSAERSQMKPCSEARRESGELLKFQDGLQVLWDGSFKIKKRLLLSPAEAKRIVLATIDSRFLNSTVEQPVKEPNWRQVAAAFGDNAPEQTNQAPDVKWSLLPELDRFRSWLKLVITDATFDLTHSWLLRGLFRSSGDN